jgi:DNA-nicking Smr family endonuclease
VSEDKMTDWESWREEIKGVKKLSSKKIEHSKAKKPIVVQQREVSLVAPKANHKKLIHGDTADIDKSSRQKMDRGEYEIDAELDLHGFTREQAFRTLEAFIEVSYVMQRRMVLVITGKGIKSKPSDVKLRDELPNWLNRDHIKNKIIRFTSAIQKHGGAGAFYILIKRARKK